jgi:hypothetical protein
MDLLIPVILIILGALALNSKDQGRRIALLARYLGKYQIEKLMENLTQGYMRALGEPDPERREQIWSLLNTAERELAEQFNSFVTEFSRVDEADTRVSTFPLALPYADRLFPDATFDLRKALNLHAQGITQAARNSHQQTPRDKAFTLSAELFLMQHTCHWFCRSKGTASARMLARHKTTYAQLVASVAPETRQAYAALINP